MELQELLPGLDVIYYRVNRKKQSYRLHNTAEKLPATIVSIGKVRVTIQLADGTYRIVDPSSLVRPTQERNTRKGA